MDYYWKLEKYSGQNSRFRCPQCKKARQYTRFINSEGAYAPFEYGKCNRLDKCGYFSYPKGIQSNAPVFVVKEEPQEFIDWNNYNYNLDTSSDLIRFFCKHHPEEQVIKVLKKYYVRTEGNSIIFTYVDKRNRLTYVKKMMYENGHRKGAIYTPYKAEIGRFKQCLFGLHIVTKDKPVGVVESEKTVLLCDMFYPKITWVATGGEQMISKVNVLDNATIFADKGKAFQNWKKKLDPKKFRMDNSLEFSGLKEGSDLADYIVAYCSDYGKTKTISSFRI
jgi:hypothetical protein